MLDQHIYINICNYARINVYYVVHMFNAFLHYIAFLCILTGTILKTLGDYLLFDYILAVQQKMSKKYKNSMISFDSRH